MATAAGNFVRDVRAVPQVLSARQQQIETAYGLMDQGFTNTEIARRVGTSESSIRRWRRNRAVVSDQPTRDEGRSGALGSLQEVEQAPFTELPGILDRAVRPLAIPPLPAVREIDPEQPTLTAVLFGDTHVPYHDPRALAIVLMVIAELRPDMVIHMGDLLDCYTLSTYDKNPDKLDSLQEEIDLARQLLGQVRVASPTSRLVLLEGNHEDRLRRVLWRMPAEAQALARLTAMQRLMTWPTLLGLDELQVEFVPWQQQSSTMLLPKFILKHGDKVRSQSAYTARAEHERYGRSGASGHTHRLGMYWQSDHNGNHVWLETGCTCSLRPEYTPDPNWQQGCVVLTVDRVTGALQAEPVYIHNGRAVWRGSVLQA